MSNLEDQMRHGLVARLAAQRGDGRCRCRPWLIPAGGAASAPVAVACWTARLVQNLDIDRHGILAAIQATGEVPEGVSIRPDEKHVRIR